MPRGRPPDPREAHRRVLGVYLSAWTRAELVMRCDAPQHGRRVAGRWCAALERERPGRTLGWWCDRVRCAACGAPPADVALRDPDRGGDWWIALRGYDTPGQEGGPVEDGETHRVRWWPDHPLLSGRPEVVAPELSLFGGEWPGV